MRRRYKIDSASDYKTKKDESGEKNKNFGGERLDRGRWTDDFWTCFYCSLPLFFVYLYTLHPSVTGGDSGELITAAYELGVAHPPGYPLFTIAARLFLAIPFNTPAWRVNLMNALFASASSLFLQLSVLRSTRSVGVSLLAHSFFSLNKVTWRWSTSTEVFSLNNLFITIIINMLIYIESLPSPPSSSSSSSLLDQYKIHCRIYMNKFKALSFLMGLSLTNQHTVVFVVIFAALWTAVFLFNKSMLKTKVIFKSVVFFLLGLLPYLYLPVSSLLGISRFSWGDQGSITGFLQHILRLDYGTFRLVKTGEGSGLLEMWMLYTHHIQHKMSELVPWLALVGFATCFSWAVLKKHTSVLFVGIASLTYIIFFCMLCNLSLQNPLHAGVIERFWLQCDIGLVLMACIGCHTAISSVLEKFMGVSRLPLTSVVASILSVVLLFLQLKTFFMQDQNQFNAMNEFGRIVIDYIPKKAIVLTNGDLPSNVLRYLHAVEGSRPDISIIDTEMLSYPWFLERNKKFHKQVVFPGDRWALISGSDDFGKKTFTFKQFLDANIHRRPILSCIGIHDKDSSWNTTYQTWPYGVCQSFQLISGRNFKMNPEQWGQKTQELADKWTYKHDAFERTSWERVVNDEMWYSKVSSAFYMYNEAMRTTDMNYKAELLLQSYHLYFRAIRLNQAQSRMNPGENFPAFWHKNFALSCERLLHVEPLEGIDKVKLCKMSIFHFEQYINMEPKTLDRGSILQAIEVLKQRFDYLKNIKKADKALKKTVERLDKLEELTSEMQKQHLQGDNVERHKDKSSN